MTDIQMLTAACVMLGVGALAKTWMLFSLQNRYNHLRDWVVMNVMLPQLREQFKSLPKEEYEKVLNAIERM